LIYGTAMVGGRGERHGGGRWLVAGENGTAVAGGWWLVAGGRGDGAGPTTDH